MTILDAIQNGANTAFNVIDSMLTSAIYTSEGIEIYDATSGVASNSFANYAISILLEDYTSKEVDDDKILRTDQKGSIPQANLTPTPKQGDIITIAGVIWFVKDIKTDAANAVWILQLRK